MRHLNRPKPGEPISAGKLSATVDELDAARRVSVSGVGVTRTTVSSAGRSVALQPADSLRLVQITSEWKHHPPGDSTPPVPGKWHYCEARLLPFSPIEGWSNLQDPPKDEHKILLWSPAGYTGIDRDGMRAVATQMIPPRYAEDDWCWAAYEQASGLWVVIDGYEQMMEVTLYERLYACDSAESRPILNAALPIEVFDDFGQVAAWRFAQFDEVQGKYYVNSGTRLLVRHMADPGRNHWVVILLTNCEGDESSSGSDSSDSSPSPSQSEPSVSSVSEPSASSQPSPSSEPSASEPSPPSASEPSVPSFSEPSVSEPSAPSASEPSVSSESPSSEPSGSPSGSAESPGASSEPSVSAPSESSGSDKSTAIVPATWSPTGYAALAVLECPEVRFDDVIVATVPRANGDIPIDQHYLEVCHPGTVEVCGCAADEPVLVGARVEGDHVVLRFTEDWPQENVRLVIRLTGIRKGFAGWRLPDRTREQFLANEKTIKAAYPGAGR